MLMESGDRESRRLRDDYRNRLKKCDKFVNCLCDKLGFLKEIPLSLLAACTLKLAREMGEIVMSLRDDREIWDFVHQKSELINGMLNSGSSSTLAVVLSFHSGVKFCPVV